MSSVLVVPSSSSPVGHSSLSLHFNLTDRLENLSTSAAVSPQSASPAFSPASSVAASPVSSSPASPRHVALPYDSALFSGTARSAHWQTLSDVARPRIPGLLTFADVVEAAMAANALDHAVANGHNLTLEKEDKIAAEMTSDIGPEIPPTESHVPVPTGASSDRRTHRGRLFRRPSLSNPPTERLAGASTTLASAKPPIKFDSRVSSAASTARSINSQSSTASTPATKAKNREMKAIVKKKRELAQKKRAGRRAPIRVQDAIKKRLSPKAEEKESDIESPKDASVQAENAASPLSESTQIATMAQTAADAVSSESSGCAPTKTEELLPSQSDNTGSISAQSAVDSSDCDVSKLPQKPVPSLSKSNSSSGLKRFKKFRSAPSMDATPGTLTLSSLGRWQRKLSVAVNSDSESETEQVEDRCLSEDEIPADPVQAHSRSRSHSPAMPQHQQAQAQAHVHRSNELIQKRLYRPCHCQIHRDAAVASSQLPPIFHSHSHSEPNGPIFHTQPPKSTTRSSSAVSNPTHNPSISTIHRVVQRARKTVAVEFVRQLAMNRLAKMESVERDIQLDRQNQRVKWSGSGSGHIHSFSAPSSGISTPTRTSAAITNQNHRRDRELQVSSAVTMYWNSVNNRVNAPNNRYLHVQATAVAPMGPISYSNSNPRTPQRSNAATPQTLTPSNSGILAPINSFQALKSSLNSSGLYH